MAALETSDPGLLVLISLAAEPRHGHGIQLDVADYAGVRLGPGTLYGAIGRLEAQGLIEPMSDVGRRRPYRLTEEGRRRLSTRLGGMRRTLAAGLRRMATAS